MQSQKTVIEKVLKNLYDFDSFDGEKRQGQCEISEKRGEKKNSFIRKSRRKEVNNELFIIKKNDISEEISTINLPSKMDEIKEKCEEMKKEKLIFIKPAAINNNDEGIFAESLSEDFQVKKENNATVMKTNEVVLEEKLGEKGPSFYSKLKKIMSIFNGFKINQRRESFSLGFFEYVIYLMRKNLSCLRRSKKEKLLDECEKKLVEELDLISILLKIHEIEKIKLTIYNEDQLMLFDSISKPFFVTGKEDFFIKIKEEFWLSTSKKMAFMIDDYKNRRQSKYADSLKKVKADSINSEVNKRILKLIENKE